MIRVVLRIDIILMHIVNILFINADGRLRIKVGEILPYSSAEISNGVKLLGQFDYYAEARKL